MNMPEANDMVGPGKEPHGLLKGPPKDCYNVLLADDSEADRFLMRISIDRVPRLKIVAEFSNGTEVITYFKRAASKDGEQAAWPIPDLLLLDLKMPFKDGFQVLEWLQTQHYDDLTVVVLTVSVHQDHIKRALDLGADYYQVKARSNHDRDVMALTFERYLSNASGVQSVSRPVEKLRRKDSM